MEATDGVVLEMRVGTYVDYAGVGIQFVQRGDQAHHNQQLARHPLSVSRRLVHTPYALDDQEVCPYLVVGNNGQRIASAETLTLVQLPGSAQR